MSTKKYFLLYLAVFSAFSVAAQKSGYIIIDSVFSTGVIFDQTKALNHREVKFAKSPVSRQTTYTPSTAKEYGFQKQIYVRRKVSIGSDSTPYFLLTLVKGKTNLYVLKLQGKKRFFIENEKGFVELKKENKMHQGTFKSQLTNCEIAQKYVPSLRFSEKALRRHVAFSNTCYEDGPWPLARWTVAAGFSTTTLNVTDEYGKPVKFKTTSPYVGIGADLPIGTKPNWFINLQAVFQKSDHETHETRRIAPSVYYEYDFSINTTTFGLPVFVKRSFAKKNLKGFVGAGTLFNYHIQSKSKMIEERSPSVSYSSKKDLLVNKEAGVLFGAGIEYAINAKNGISVEVRLNKGGSPAHEGQKASAIQILTSFYF